MYLRNMAVRILLPDFDDRIYASGKRTRKTQIVSLGIIILASQR
jgi:hypothetical protein